MYIWLFMQNPRPITKSIHDIVVAITFFLIVFGSCRYASFSLFGPDSHQMGQIWDQFQYILARWADTEIDLKMSQICTILGLNWPKMWPTLTYLRQWTLHTSILTRLPGFVLSLTVYHIILSSLIVFWKYTYYLKRW